MSEITLERVSKHWGQIRAVDDVSFTADEGRFLVLLGPSGCGKSTTLRLVAGLEQVTSGRIFINDTEVTDLAPAKRRISMVFQSYALFPHLDVAENILFGLKVRRVVRAERDARLDRVATMVGLSELLDRRPSELSGGQRQRVALARAVIAENLVCLMDEPLSNLDAQLRQDMRVEIRALQRRLGMTVVYVTHDQVEAMSMADKIILMRDGRVEQKGTPEALYDCPATIFAARFIGTPPMNLVDLADGRDGAVIAGEAGTAVAEGAGEGHKLGIRPEHISLTDSGGIAVELLSSDYLGADSILTTRVGSQSLLVRVPGRVKVDAGRPARLNWRPEMVHLFDAATGRRHNGRRAVALDG